MNAKPTSPNTSGSPDTSTPKPAVGTTPNATSASVNTESHTVSGSHSSSASDTAGSMKAKAKAEASTLADHARDMADARLEEGKAEATSRMDRTADQIRNAGQEFGDDSYQAQAAEYLASNLSQAADMIRGKDLGAIADDVTTFARRNPALFLGGAALLGFAAARMMKASDRGDDRASFERSPMDRSPLDRSPAGRAPYDREPYV